MVRSWVRSAARPLVIAMAFGAAAMLAPTPSLAQRGANAQAEDSRSLRERFASQSLPQTARYQASNGTSFVLDRSGSRPLMRFDNSSEVWSLRPVPAPAGDVLYRNDAGDLVLRVTRNGGLTLFTPQSPGGIPVSVTGSADRLSPPPMSVMQLTSFLMAQSHALLRALGRPVLIDAPEITPGNEAVYADAAATAVEAVQRMTRSRNLRPEAMRLRQIVIREGSRPDVSFNGAVLLITVVPSRGVEGRPSSARIVRAFSMRP